MTTPTPAPAADRAPHAAGAVDDVPLTAANLLDVADLLGADTFSTVDGAVTFLRRRPEPRVWRGRLGERGVQET